MATVSELKRYWENLLHSQERDDSLKVFGRDRAKQYPSEAATDLLSAYFVTGEVPYLEGAKRQLAFSRELQDTKQLLPWGGFIYRDQHSRQVYNLAVAATVLKDNLLLKWAEESAESLRLSLEARYYEPMYVSTNRPGFRTRGAIYRYAAPPPSEPRYEPLADLIESGSGRWLPGVIDPNQNAAIGLGFTLLYQNPASIYHPTGSNHALALDVLRLIQEEFTATTWLQSWQKSGEGTRLLPQNDPRMNWPVYSGGLPMNDSDDRRRNYNTMYASLTFLYWAIAAAYWKAQPASVSNLGGLLENGLNAAGRWLSTGVFADPSVKSALRYSDNGLQMSPDYPPWYECWYRFALYWVTGSLSAGQRRAWADRALDEVIKCQPGCDDSGFPSFATPFCFFSLLGIPPAEYLPTG
jgi:hypothetical protein